MKKANSEAYSGPCQTSKMEAFAQTTLFAKSSILDVWQDSESSNDFVEKAPSKMFDRVLNLLLWPLITFAKLLAICLLNLINVTALVKSK